VDESTSSTLHPNPLQQQQQQQQHLLQQQQQQENYVYFKVRKLKTKYLQKSIGFIKRI